MRDLNHLLSNLSLDKMISNVKRSVRVVQMGLPVNFTADYRPKRPYRDPAGWRTDSNSSLKNTSSLVTSAGATYSQCYFSSSSVASAEPRLSPLCKQKHIPRHRPPILLNLSISIISVCSHPTGRRSVLYKVLSPGSLSGTPWF